MAPERIPYIADIRIDKLDIIQVVEEQRRRDGVPQQELQNLVLWDQGGGEQPVVGHQECGVLQYLLLHHLDQHHEGEVSCLLHLLHRGDDVAADGGGWHSDRRG